VSIPLLGSQYWIALLVDGTLNVIATILQLKAIKISDLSLTIPLLAFTPLFLLFISPLILGQYPTPLGIIGVILIVIGSYVLNIQRRNAGYLAPFKAMLKHRCPRFMLYTAFFA